MKCKDVYISQHFTLVDAIKMCKELGQHCKGIEDRFCNGTLVSTCAYVIPSDMASGESCIYVQEGRVVIIFLEL